MRGNESLNWSVTDKSQERVKIRRRKEARESLLLSLKDSLKVVSDTEEESGC